MKTPPSLVPDLETLTAGLTATLRNGRVRRPVRVLKRKPPRFMSTFPNEIVTCVLPNGRRRRVFIKYEGGCFHNCFGHRGGVAYEAQVYERLLNSIPEFHPKCLGAHHDPRAGGTWLILEFVYCAERVSDLSSDKSHTQASACVNSARWLARFHAAFESSIHDPAFSFLKRYDAEYYRGWASRTFEFAAPLRSRFPWLRTLEDCGDAWFAPLLMPPLTVIHGEFYAKTVLVRDEKLFVTDWESAAVAPGEIDLAALSEGKHWRGSITRQCEREYQRIRRSGRFPGDFRQRLDAARMYLHFRWLGEGPEKALREKNLWRYQHLRAPAKNLGLI
jgi:thiamine kinase-like enzyme